MTKEQEIALLEDELRELQESNLAAWNMYGSELCADEMIAKEQRLRDKIQSLRDLRITTIITKNAN
jgi:hypothetical protein